MKSDLSRSSKLIHLAALFTAAALTACGGGGGDSNASPSPSPTPSPSPSPSPSANTVTASQSGAASLVSVVNDNVDTVVKANAAGGIPGGALIASLPTGITSNGSQSCPGGGNYAYSMTTNDTTYQVSSYNFDYNNCNYTYGSYSSTYDGTAAWTYDYTSNTVYSVSYNYNLTYSYSYGSQTETQTIQQTSTCNYNNGSVSCTYNVGSAAVSPPVMPRTPL